MARSEGRWVEKMVTYMFMLQSPVCLGQCRARATPGEKGKGL